jgi:hypothetical protein
MALSSACAKTALFAAFGSFAMLVMTDFHGPMLNRLRNQATLVVACCALICLGTSVSRLPGLRRQRWQSHQRVPNVGPMYAAGEVTQFAIEHGQARLTAGGRRGGIDRRAGRGSCHAEAISPRDTRHALDRRGSALLGVG